MAEIVRAEMQAGMGRDWSYPAAGSAMRAVRIVAPRRAEMVEAPLPRPGPFQVRVRLEGCGICGSNLPVWQGRPWFDYPLEPGALGHEGWGRIDEIGAGVKNFQSGDRVALLSHHGFAEFDMADADHIVRLSSGRTIFPAEALGCAINVFRRSEIREGQTVAVIGVGFLGALLVQLAARSGARVIAISRRSFALEVARRCGAREALELREPKEIVAAVMERTGGNGCERVIEAAGEQPALDLAADLTGVRGRLIIAGYHQGTRRVNLQLWNWRGLDVVNAHERDPRICLEGMRYAAEALARGAIDDAFLYTHSFTLEEFPKAFRALEERPDGFLKAWIQFGTAPGSSGTPRFGKEPSEE